MAELKARIGPKATKAHENEYDSDASSHDPQTLSPNKYRSDHQTSSSRPRQHSGPLSLLSRMGLNSGGSEGGTSEGEDATSVQQSLLARVEKETSHSSPNIGSTGRDNAHILDSNGYHDNANSNHAQRSSQPSLPNGQSNAFVTQSQFVDNGCNGSSHNSPNSRQTKCNDGLVVKPSTKEVSPPHKSILHDSSKLNHSPSDSDASQYLSEEGMVAEKKTILRNLPHSQEQEFEDGELVDAKLPSQKVRDLLLPLVLKNAAHREKEGDSDLSRHTAHRVLSDEVCASFMDQMKEVRTEMHAHKNRSSSNPPQIQPTGEMNNSEAAYSKVGQAPPLGPRAMRLPIDTGKYMPPNDEIATQSSSSKDIPQPTSAVSSHSHDPIPPSNDRRREPEFQHTPSPEHRGFHEYDQDRRYSQHRDPRFDVHRSHSRSRSPGRPSRGQPYYRSSDQSRHMARSRSPVTLPTSPGPLPPLHRRRRSSSRRVYFRNRAVRKSPEDVSGRRSGSPFGTSNQDRMPERRQSPLRDFRRTDGNILPHWDAVDSLQSPVYLSSRKHFGRRGADKVESHDGNVHSGSEFARRSASLPRKRQRQFFVEPPLPPTPPLHSPPQPTLNPYFQSPQMQALFEQRQGSHNMEGLSPVTGSTSSHLTDSAAGSYHQITKLMVVDNQDMDGRVNEEVGMRSPKTNDDVQQSGPTVLPCHNVPGVWFAKVALDDIGTLECSFEVDEVTALKWDLQQPNVSLPERERKEKLQLQICCLSQKLVQSLMQSLKPDATAQDIATAIVTIENDWPTPGHLIILVNPQDKNKRVWLPDKLEPSCLPVCIEDCVFGGQNIVQFIQLSGMSERMFLLFATTGPLVDGHQPGDHVEFVPAPLQHSIDGGRGDACEIGFEEVIISDLR